MTYNHSRFSYDHWYSRSRKGACAIVSRYEFGSGIFVAVNSDGEKCRLETTPQPISHGDKLECGRRRFCETIHHCKSEDDIRRAEYEACIARVQSSISREIGEAVLDRMRTDPESEVQKICGPAAVVFVRNPERAARKALVGGRELGMRSRRASCTTTPAMMVRFKRFQVSRGHKRATKRKRGR